MSAHPPAAPAGAAAADSDWRDYLALLKPRVVVLVVFTAAVGMLAAPGAVDPVLGLVALIAVAVGAGAAGALNQWYEADLDARMRRTATRPLPGGRIGRDAARDFGAVLAAASVVVMLLAAGPLAAALLTASILYYVGIYTVWLKPRTPQNIVIGGAAGAFPPLIGWAAATGSLTALPWLMFAIVFLWTPPHFWALALFVRRDYANVGMPMLPLTHGLPHTRAQIWWYSWALVVTTLAPVALGLLGALYAAAAAALGAAFLVLAHRVWRNTAIEPAAMAPEKRLFGYSIVYLFALFTAIAADGWVR